MCRAGWEAGSFVTSKRGWKMFLMMSWKLLIPGFPELWNSICTIRGYFMGINVQVSRYLVLGSLFSFHYFSLIPCRHRRAWGPGWAIWHYQSRHCCPAPTPPTCPTRPFSCYKQCWRSVTFWCGSGSADPYLWLMDPIPFFGYFKEVEKLIFFPYFLLWLTHRHIIFSLKNLIFCYNYFRKGKDPYQEQDPYLWLMDPDPGGPKTCGSGSPTQARCVNCKSNKLADSERFTCHRWKAWVRCTGTCYCPLQQ